MSPRPLNRGKLSQGLAVVRRTPLEDLAVVFEDLLDVSVVATGVFRDRMFSPMRTFWLFLSQVLSPEGSCQEAVNRALAWLAVEEGQIASKSTSAYCQARKRLPQQMLDELREQVLGHLPTTADEWGLWQGRTVKVVDGTTVSLPDTPENQASYPQPTSQAPGCGFPMMRLVCLFALASGAMVGCAEGPLSKGERTLWRGLWDGLRPGDVVLGDRGFCSFAELHLLRQRGVDSVVRLHQRRSVGVVEVERLGRDDQVVDWVRGGPCPEWLEPGQWADLPETMRVRQVNVRVTVAGMRTQTLTLATTLLDPARYPKAALAALYLRRWLAELYLRSLKTTLGMDPLRCRTPEMARKELAMYLMAYNLVRALMVTAARKYPIEAHRLSFANALATVRVWAPILAPLKFEESHREAFEGLLYYVAQAEVGNRPGRREPRAVKRRPKQFQLLTKDRHVFQEVKHRKKAKRALS